MCGIVAAAAQRDVAPLLIAGLKALEYRGYDSAGLAVLQQGEIRRVREKGKVREMESQYLAAPASRIRAGPPTACRTRSTRIRMSPATSRWYTTASSRTTPPCAASLKR